jgi:hypothetical protein
MGDPMRCSIGSVLLLGSGIVAAAFLSLVPPIPQDPAYHAFADRRTILGVPHFWNVASNLPFVLVGLAGLRRLRRGSLPGGLPELHPHYALFFLGTALVGVGSGYYHLAPSNATLLWDRLAMTIAFMPFFAAMLGERLSLGVGRRTLLPLLILGPGSVLYWYGTELLGRGDLRPYALVQFLPLLLLPVLLLGFPSPLAGSGYLWGALGAYGIAKLFEWQDAPLFALLGMGGGHTLKHLAAAAGASLFLLALERRQAAGACPPSGD